VAVIRLSHVAARALPVSANEIAPVRKMSFFMSVPAKKRNREAAKVEDDPRRPRRD
jgi:hypothetical protein